jgi:hypothetical protein
MDNNLKTYGDLKKALKSISLKQKGDKIAGLAVDTITGFIPGFDTAKTTFDFIKAAISKPDTKKTQTWLDKLDIDDETSKIVDDTIENAFMSIIAKSIESQPDNKELESDFNMNQKLIDFIREKYKGRTVSGIKEETQPKLQGSNLNIELFKKLVPNVNPSYITSTINLVKQNKSLNNAANKVLADMMTAMIKTSDDTLLTKIFQNLKQMEVK